VPDPFGGSEYMEKLTDELEAAARAYLDRIDAMGGTLAAIERGFIQVEIQNAAYQYQRAVEDGRQIVIGVNKFQSQEPARPQTFRVNPALEHQQIERLKAVRSSRSATDAATTLKALDRAARTTENLLPRIYDCCNALVTVGEISDTLRQVFGEYRETF
jgi:methylmalonyl-CoA mutase N-terminal domain/subunit